MGAEFLTLAALDKRHGSFGRAREVRSEHFLLRTDAPLATVVPFLFDLETLYADFVERFGVRWNLTAVIEPIRIHLHREKGTFPAFNADRRSCYQPPGSGDVCFSYVDRDVVPRLLAIVVEPLLYRTLADGFTTPDPGRHACTWLEIGLGGYIAQSNHGPSGRLQRRTPSLSDPELALARQPSRPELKNLIHIDHRRIFDRDPVARCAFGACPALVHFLMLEDHGHADRFH